MSLSRALIRKFVANVKMNNDFMNNDFTDERVLFMKEERRRKKKNTRTCTTRSCNTVRGVDYSFENRVKFTRGTLFPASTAVF